MFLHRAAMGMIESKGDKAVSQIILKVPLRGVSYHLIFYLNISNFSIFNIEMRLHRPLF